MNNLLLAQNREILNKFLVPYHQIKIFPENNPYGYIYCIENIISHKKYIGSAYSTWTDVKNPSPFNHLRKRASQYLYEYNCIKEQRPNAAKFTRRVVRAMVEEGIEKFIMYPICTTTMTTHKLLEKLFIDYYDTVKNGYNSSNKGANLNRIGRKLMAKDKLLRSTGIVAINLNRKEIQFSDSMKLFADKLGSTKDMIKNVVRRASPYRGWFIFYIDPDKRSEILVKMLNDQTSYKHSNKAKLFYQELYNAVTTYLANFADDEYFSDFTKLEPLVYTDKNNNR